MTTQPEKPARRRRRFHISLRGLMLLVLILGGGLGWIIYQAKVQREAVAGIIRHGGIVIYHWQFRSDGQVDPQGEPPVPKWLIRWLGPDYFGHVVWVTLEWKGGDAAMPHVARLPRLKRFFDVRSGLSDAQAARLGDLPELEEVILFSSKPLTGAGLAGLSKLARLKHLNLGVLPVHDQDLAAIAGVASLQTLDVHSAKITDAGLVHLRGLTNLRRLTLTGTRVADLKSLVGLKQLQSLDLSGTPITDEGLAPVAELVNLRDLNLAGTAITDEGLPPLRKLPKLDVLDLNLTRITDAGLIALGDNPPLGEIKLSGTAITDAGINLVERWSNLRWLRVRKTKATSDRLYSLSGARPKLCIDR